MADWQTGIVSLDEARDFFKAMGCTGYHMMREFPERYDEYRALGVTRDQERAWRAEEINERVLDLVAPPAGKDERWSLHSTLADMACDQRDEASVRILHKATQAVLESLPLRDGIIVAENLLGRNDLQYRKGPSFMAKDLGCDAVAADFLNWAVMLCERAAAGGVEARRAKEALETAAAVREKIGL